MKQPIAQSGSGSSIFAAMHKSLTLNRKGGRIMKKLIVRSSSLLLLLTLLVVTFMAAECKKPVDNPPQSIQLQGTQWKLEGIVNVQTGEMQVLEPVDCEQCYTLEFDTDTTASGKSTTNIFLLNLNMPPYLGIGTEVCEMGDGYLFTNILCFITSYEHDSENAKLKFFYQREEKNYYLIFKML
ncbi:MAG: hypothetical protein LBK03_06070 [Bacteroidales bacterium]|jgi:hypothetical protein|nr:hypothetical protein [Bacteroidales bacterium]